LKLTEQYIQAMQEILERSKVVMLPPEKEGARGGDMSAKNLATMFTLYKQMVGQVQSGVVGDKEQESQMMKNLE